MPRRWPALLQMFRRIQTGRYRFYPEYWSSVSKDAQDFVTKILVVDVKKRATVEEVLPPSGWLLPVHGGQACPRLTSDCLPLCCSTSCSRINGSSPINRMPTLATP